ncbi:serotransferrin-B [Bombina bombina]|uniref:serotransferrin-B n=1 Tax=Bombina bombina TaxID=8345 RepID=UPI00235ACD39|nr:serotransferrin-B [Bombina bombina]
MGPTFQVALCLGMLALSFALPKTREVRWCVKSESENKKCKELANQCKHPDITLSCVKKANTDDCFVAIQNGEADAIGLDGGDVYRGSLHPYDLKPIMSEKYDSKTGEETCYHPVVVAKKSTTFTIRELKNKKTCHTGVGKTAGWNIPIGWLIKEKFIEWPRPISIEKAVTELFSFSCAPGAKEPNLCKQCAGIGDKKCTRSPDEPYYNYDGAFKCLKDDKGDVAFVKHTTVPVEESKNYELLCPDNTRKPIEDYKKCNFATVPAHAVVTRSIGDKTKDIVEYLQNAEEKQCKLFSSEHGKDLLFKDSAIGFLALPSVMDTFLYLSPNYYTSIKALHGVQSNLAEGKVRWCTQNLQERTKCDDWTPVSGGAIECTSANSAEECIQQVLKGDADAVTLDGGFLYTAGKCGLIPVMSEYYDKDNLAPCRSSGTTSQGVYYAVAVGKSVNKNLSWKNLRGKKSCHTGVGRTAGWNIPVGLIYNETQNCNIGEFFSQSCAPGSDVNSNLCKLCIGNPKCAPNAKELLYGYSGALRCLAGEGDVAFVKHTTVLENTDGANKADWAKNLKSEDFVLLCPNGNRMPVDKYKECHLAKVPAHAIVTRPEKRKEVAKILVDQQSLFGRQGSERDMYNIFDNSRGKDLLFKDSTQCLLPIIEGTTMEQFLGEEYVSAVAGVNKCSTKSELLSACTFHKC